MSGPRHPRRAGNLRQTRISPRETAGLRSVGDRDRADRQPATCREGPAGQGACVMADLMLNFCVVEFEIRRLLENGHRDEAEQLIIAKFRAGYSSPPLLQLVADLLVLKKGEGKAWTKSRP